MGHEIPQSKRQLAAWKRWVAKRPSDVRAVAERLVPWRLYRMKTTGQRVIVVAYAEGPPSVTLRVSVLGQFNLTAFEFDVFGVDPDDLEWCDLPDADEPIGTMLTDPADIKAYQDAERPRILARRGFTAEQIQAIVAGGGSKAVH